MDIIKMLVQSKQTDVNDRIQPMFEECVGYEKLSRSDKFRNFELPIMKNVFRFYRNYIHLWNGQWNNGS